MDAVDSDGGPPHSETGLMTLSPMVDSGKGTVRSEEGVVDGCGTGATGHTGTAGHGVMTVLHALEHNPGADEPLLSTHTRVCVCIPGV